MANSQFTQHPAKTVAPPFETSNEVALLASAIHRLLPFERRHVLWRQKPRYPRFLYKFRGLDVASAESIDRLRLPLVESRLWLGAVADFNDPFDMQADTVIHGTKEEIRERIKRLVKRATQNVSPAKRIQILNEALRKPRDVIRDYARLGHERMLAQTGVCSFAGDPRSILMWSHYGKDHTGVCLQFSVSEDVFTFLRALPVKYRRDYPVHDWVNDKGSEFLALSKFIDWEYEKERRIVHLDGARKVLNFAPSALVGIILGCRITSPSEEAVRALLDERQKAGSPKMNIYRASLDPTKYRLVLERA